LFKVFKNNIKIFLFKGGIMKPERAWQRMLSGRRLDLLDPTPLDIEIQDIAHGLSFVARWNGQTSGDFPYSVAEHSLLVEKIFDELNPNSSSEARLAALLHDAPEYVLGDLISPVKAAVGYGYENLDEKLTVAIHRRFGLPAKVSLDLKRKIKKADKVSAWLEAMEIAGFSKHEADKFFGKFKHSYLTQFSIQIRPPALVRKDYIEKCSALLDQI
jgi:5'-deoxynucleotidase YfbR-like HD superfamily hydrolase